MEIFELVHSDQRLIEKIPDTVAALGFFDGIHRGHQKVIKTAVNKARENQMMSAVITFHPHPSVVLQGKTDVQYITPIHMKAHILEQLNVDRLYVITFDKALSLLSPKTFIEEFITRLNVKHVVAGFDFTFGHKGKGNMKNISELAQGDFTSTVVEKVTCDGEKISSTHIRECLASGEIEQVNVFLGRCYTIFGAVVSGDQRGRTIGYPTANIKVDTDTLLPKSGVYAVQVKINNVTYDGMANLGVKPTFQADVIEPIIEVHIFNFNDDIYGERLYISWHKFIRDEKKFSGIDELITQLKNDEKTIKGYFEH